MKKQVFILMEALPGPFNQQVVWGPLINTWWI